MIIIRNIMIIVFKLWNVFFSSQIYVQRTFKEWKKMVTTKQQKRPLARCEQGSNLRGKLPLDFKSNALTTQPSQLKELSERRKDKPDFQPKQKSALQV